MLIDLTTNNSMKFKKAALMIKFRRYICFSWNGYHARKNKPKFCVSILAFRSLFCFYLLCAHECYSLL